MNWERVVFAAELDPCPDCREPWCPRHAEHYADCPCLGPTQDDVEYTDFQGVLYGRLEEVHGRSVAGVGTASPLSRADPALDIQSGQAYSDDMDTYELTFYEDRRGKHRWRLTEKRTGNIVAASSQGFASPQGARENARDTYRGLVVTLPS